MGLDECSKQAKSIPGTKKVHYLDPSDGDNLHCRLYSNQPSTHNKIDLSSDNSGCSDSEVSVSEAKGNDAVNVDDNDNGSNDEVEGNVDDNDDSNSDDDNVDNSSDGDRDSDSATLKCFLLMFSYLTTDG